VIVKVAQYSKHASIRAQTLFSFLATLETYSCWSLNRGFCQVYLDKSVFDVLVFESFHDVKYIPCPTVFHGGFPVAE